MALVALNEKSDSLRTLPGDDVRQIMWRFAERFDLQMLVQSTRAVARGPVARLVAEAMSKDLGQQVIVENVGGAGGTLGAKQVAAATGARANDLYRAALARGEGD